MKHSVGSVAHGVTVADPNGGVPSVLRKLNKWSDYPSSGEPVFPSRFIPMKTPLSKDILAEWDAASPCRWPHTVGSMLEACAAANRSLGMILNLASHGSLYASDLPQDGSLETCHVELTSKMLPSPAAMQTAIRCAQEFWSRRPDDFIAIHCAYGYNRTGFTVCCFLIEVMGLSVEAALASFAMSRPPGVKHEKFVAELHLRYHALKPSIPVFDWTLCAPFYACSSAEGQAQLDRIRKAHRLEEDGAAQSPTHQTFMTPQNQLITPNLSHCDLIAHGSQEHGSFAHLASEDLSRERGVHTDSIGREEAAELLHALEELRAQQAVAARAALPPLAQPHDARPPTRESRLPPRGLLTPQLSGPAARQDGDFSCRDAGAAACLRSTALSSERVTDAMDESCGSGTALSRSSSLQAVGNGQGPLVASGGFDRLFAKRTAGRDALGAQVTDLSAATDVHASGAATAGGGLGCKVESASVAATDSLVKQSFASAPVNHSLRCDANAAFSVDGHIDTSASDSVVVLQPCLSALPAVQTHDVPIQTSSPKRPSLSAASSSTRKHR